MYDPVNRAKRVINKRETPVAVGVKCNPRPSYPIINLPACYESDFITTHLLRTSEATDRVTWLAIQDLYEKWRKNKDPTYIFDTKKRKQLKKILIQAAYIPRKNEVNRVSYVKLLRPADQAVQHVAS